MVSIERLSGVQAILLADHGMEAFQPFLLGAYRHIMSMRGLTLKIENDDPDAMRLVGPDDYSVSVTRYSSPADLSQFEEALASPVTALLTPDIADRIKRHRSHIVLDVRRESSEPLVRAKALLDLVSSGGQGITSDTIVTLQKQIEALVELVRTVTGFEPASSVFLPRSNMLFGLDAFKGAAEMGPSLLTIHPRLLSSDGSPYAASGPVGIYTSGAADFVGREIYVPAVSLGWRDLHRGAVEFVRAAIAPRGRVTPDGETFGDQKTLKAYRVQHLEAQSGPPTMGRALYQLTLTNEVVTASAPQQERRKTPRAEPAVSPPRMAAPASSYAPPPIYSPPPFYRSSQPVAPAAPVRQETPSQSARTQPTGTSYQQQSYSPPPPPKPAPSPPQPAPQRPVEIQSLDRKDVLQRVGDRPAAGSFARGFQSVAPTKTLFGRK